MEKRKQAQLMLLLAMLIFGTIGIFRRMIPLPSGIIACGRGIIGTLFLLLVIFLKKKPLNRQAIHSNLRKLILSGIFMGMNWVLLFEAYQYTSVSTATLCYYMAPVLVVLVSPLVLKEKLTLSKLVCILIAMGGMVCVTGSSTGNAGGSSDIKGIVMGLGAAMLYAAVILLNQRIRQISAYDKTIMQLGSAAVILLLYSVVVETIPAGAITPTSLLFLLLIGIIHTGIAFTLYFGSMDKLSAQSVALFSYLDPVTALVLSAWLLDENLGISGIIGAVMILGAAAISECSEKSGFILKIGSNKKKSR